MKKHQNFILFIIVLVLSYLSASYVGDWYDQIDPQYGGWISSKTDAINLAGFLMAYTFFVPFVIELFSKNNKNKLEIILLAPIILLYLGYNWKLIWIPILFAITGCLIAKLIHLVIRLALKLK